MQSLATTGAQDKWLLDSKKQEIFPPLVPRNLFPKKTPELTPKEKVLKELNEWFGEQKDEHV